MSVLVEHAANHLVATASGKLAPGAASRLLYLAHMRYMGETEGCLLVSDRFFATSTGPGVPRFEDGMRRIGRNPIQRPFQAKQGIVLPPDMKAAVEAAWRDFGGLEVDALIKLVQQPGTAWKRVYRQSVAEAISDRLIFEEFLAFHDSQLPAPEGTKARAR